MSASYTLDGSRVPPPVRRRRETETELGETDGVATARRRPASLLHLPTQNVGVIAGGGARPPPRADDEMEDDLQSRLAARMLTTHGAGGNSVGTVGGARPYSRGCSSGPAPPSAIHPTLEECRGGAATATSLNNNAFPICAAVCQGSQAMQLMPTLMAVDSANFLEALEDEDEDYDKPNTSGRNVSFKTHDEVRQFDEQLDQLKLVDETFFEVAHFLLDVVGTSTDITQFLQNTGSAADNDLEIVPSGAQQPGSGVLAKLFGCSVGDISGTNIAAEQTTNGGPRVNKVDGHPLTRRKHFLSKKLVKDFSLALEFRMNTIGSIDNEEIVSRTREVARRVDAYGLPFMTRAEIGGEGSPKNSDETEPSLFTQFPDPKNVVFMPGDKKTFPVLPTDDDDDDDDDDCGNDENDQFLASSSLMVKTLPQPAIPKPSLPESICSFFSPKSATPSKGECQKRLTQIKTEISKVQTMLDTTHNDSVREACRERLVKLSAERRLFQIIQEREKIQYMLKTSKVDKIRCACKARLNQLLIEMEALEIDQDERDDAEVGDDYSTARVVDHGIGNDENNDDNAEDDEKNDENNDGNGGDWFERAVKYVNSSKRSSEYGNGSISGARGDEPDFSGAPNLDCSSGRSTQLVENRKPRMVIDDRTRVLSPMGRNELARPMPRSRQPAAARAVNSKTSWLEFR